MVETCQTPDRSQPVADPYRTIQIHPTRKCNLACLHCYSFSSPNMKEMIDIETLKRFLEISFENGYNNISVSGGEPFLYSHLEELLKFTRSIGYQNTMASNGMLLQSERNQRILEYVDLIAISVDGPPELHDQIRGQKGAFEKTMKGVEVLKKLEKPFGLIHTITPQSWQSLIWLADFAYESGAKLLQLHPLEMQGRASEDLIGSEIDDTLAHQAYILASYLKSKYANKMIVQLDLLHREYIEAFPQVVNVFDRQCSQNKQIADLLDTIIVEESGKIIPIAYGFDSTFEIGNIYQFQNSDFAKYTEEKLPKLKKLFSQTIEKIVNNKDADIVNWNEILVNQSQLN
ncbi:MAG: radical SAM protein [Bacteroidota bacterium]